MRTSPIERLRAPRRRGLQAAGLGLLLLTLPLEAGAQQLREVISHQVAVAQDEASLHVEFVRDGEVDISFRDGVVRIDGEDVGRFAWGDDLASAWRELLGRAITLDDGPLAKALYDWTPPPDLAGDAATTASRIDTALEQALEAAGSEAAPAPPAPPAPGEGLESLLGRTDRLMELAGAVEGMEVDQARVRIGEDVEVAEGEVVAGDLIVIDGDLDVRGEIEGDVVVVGGTISTFEGSRIGGDVRLVDGRLVRRGGTIDGDWTQVDTETVVREVRDRIREEVRRELRDELDAHTGFQGDRSDGWGVLAPLRNVGRGLAALIGDLLKTFVVALVGGAVVFFARRNVEVVAETARRAPARAAVVGLSGAFLVLPVYVLGTIALAISIIGLPVLLAWVPLFPVAVGLAMGLGYYAAAANVGEWIAERRFPGTDWIRRSNLYTLVIGGVVALMVPVLAADVVRMAGSWMGFLRGLLVVVGVLASVAATLIGFGAVLLTRAGRRPEYYRGGDFFDDWDFGGSTEPPPPPSPSPSPSPSPRTEPASGTEPDVERGGAGGGATASEDENEFDDEPGR